MAKKPFLSDFWGRQPESGGCARTAHRLQSTQLAQLALKRNCQITLASLPNEFADPRKVWERRRVSWKWLFLAYFMLWPRSGRGRLKWNLALNFRKVAREWQNPEFCLKPLPHRVFGQNPDFGEILRISENPKWAQVFSLEPQNRPFWPTFGAKVVKVRGFWPAQVATPGDPYPHCIPQFWPKMPQKLTFSGEAN